MKNDVVALLEERHALLRKLRTQLRGCARQEHARLLFRQYALALGAHIGAMSKVVYPTLTSLGWRDVQSDLLVGHAKLAHMLADLLRLKLEGSLFGECLADLLDATEHVTLRESDELLPLLGRLDMAQRVAMRLDAEPYLSRVNEVDPLLGLQITADWIEEARMLLVSRQASSVGRPFALETHAACASSP